MSLIMEAWRERGYAPPGSERMLQDYEDKLQMEQGRRDLMYALQYLPAPPPPSPPSPSPSPSPEDTRGQMHAQVYSPSAGAHWGWDTEARAGDEPGFSAGAVATGRAEPAGRDQGWAVRPALDAAAYEPPRALSGQSAPATRPAWADHIAGIDTPTLEAILAQRYAVQRGGDMSDPSANPRTDTPLLSALLRGNRQENATPADPSTPMVQNLSGKVVSSGGEPALVNLANTSRQGNTPFAGRSTITDPRAYVQPKGDPRDQPQPDPRERELQLLRMSDEPAEAHSAAEWAAAAQEYKELQIRQGRKFSRDSFYNGLWTKGMAVGAAAGTVPHDGIPRLPVQPAGYYKEYVVPTPGGGNPGPQRLVIGRDGDVHYTPDHYKNFVKIE